MLDEEKHIIITRILQGTATEAERERFREWMNTDDERMRIETVDIYFLTSLSQHMTSKMDKSLTVDIIDQMKSREKAEQAMSMPLHRVHFMTTAWFRVAAAVLIFAGIGAYLWLQPSTNKAGLTHTKPVLEKNDVLPGRDRAILTLSNGKQVVLDSAAAKTIKDGTLSIENNNGELIYAADDRVATNTMTTPRGGQYQLTLSDGTKVWLNAASSITYPTAFTGNTREVNITGEVYFEVAKNKSKPFNVKTSSGTIEVLGTAFNVQTYPDEPTSRTSLLEGKIKVNDVILDPGQAFENGKVVKTNVQQDVAWKNGAFNFQNMDLPTAFRLLGRWYDVDVTYAGKIPSKKMRGKMGRDLTLSEVLNALAEIGIHTKIEGNTLVILPE